MKLFLSGLALTSAFLITGSAMAGQSATRGATNAIEARHNFQNASAYALTGEKAVLKRVGTADKKVRYGGRASH